MKKKKEAKSEKLGLKVIFFYSTFSERFPNSDNLVWLIIIIIVPNRINSQGGIGIKYRGLRVKHLASWLHCHS